MPTTNKSLVQQVYNTSTGNLPADQVVDPTYISTPYPNWSIPINYDLGAMDLALGGLVTISVTGLLVDQTMVLSQYQPMTIVFSGTLSANIKYSLPATVGGTWIVYNNTTGAFTLSMGSPTGPTTVAIPAGGPYNVTCNSASGIAFVNGYNAANSITTDMIQNDAVTTSKILDSNITYAKLAAAVQALLVPTGTVAPYAGSTAPTGWLLASGLTIGNATSNGTARANADTQTLFELLWNSFSNTELPIYTSAGAVSTRGASATADFTASKQLALPDLRGRSVAGKDNMGGTAASRLTITLTGTTTNGSAVVTGLSSTTGLSVGMSVIGSTIPTGCTIASIDSATQVTLNSGTSVTAGSVSLRFAIVDGATLGAAGGSQNQSLIEAQLASHKHFIAAPVIVVSTALTASNQVAYLGNPNSQQDYTLVGTSTAASIGLTSATGGNQAHNNVQPTFILNYIIKL